MVHPTPRHRPFFTEDPCQERCEPQRNGQAAGSPCLTAIVGLLLFSNAMPW